ncbi:unnamed protein product [Lymnaea stagnalis]|uniref:Uncharacterized protein n=1 Tax=Lymnaea stagnalis TaxID=6523 RepID=A0AAV2IN79_LYMST
MLIRYIIVLASATIALAVLDCPTTECDCFDFAIQCNNKGLHSIPKFTQSVNILGDLDLSNNAIAILSDNSVPAGMDSINFNNNPITSISNGAFRNSATTLSSIHFSNALFTRLPDALATLNALIDLDISQMRILDWNTNVLRHAGATVNTLRLMNVGLTSWPSWMTYFTAVSRLDLSENAITSLPDNAFSQLASQLITVKLSAANLNHVPRAVTSLPAVLLLDLSQNHIPIITGVPSHATSLNFSFNLITELRDNSFARNTAFHSLDLSNNPITRISNNAFLPIISMRNLFLRNTKLTRMPLAILTLTNPSWIALEGNTDLVCTCSEKALTLYMTSHPYLYVYGMCHQEKIDTFFKVIAKNCP